jgi:hypothetical protein
MVVPPVALPRVAVLLGDLGSPDALFRWHNVAAESGVRLSHSLRPSVLVWGERHHFLENPSTIHVVQIAFRTEHTMRRKVTDNVLLTCDQSFESPVDNMLCVPALSQVVADWIVHALISV